MPRFRISPWGYGLSTLTVASHAFGLPVSEAKPTSESLPGSEGEAFLSSAAPDDEAAPHEPPPTRSETPRDDEDDREYEYDPGEDDSDSRESYDGDDYDDRERKAENAIFLEGLGAGIFYSLNYERLFFDQMSVRIGAGFMSVSASSGGTSANATVVTIPITINYVGLYSGWHGLDLGAGTTLIVLSGAASVPGASGSTSGVVPTGVGFVGYRLHPVGGPGFQLRIGAEVIVATNGAGSVAAQPWGHLSLGAAF
jgi:hypothetical protein